MPEPAFYIKRGDKASAIASTLEDAAGDAVDIQGAIIRFRMQNIRGGDLIVDDYATNAQVFDGSDGSKGNVLYTWATVATDAGKYLAEWEVTYSGGSVQSFPNGGYLLVNITPDLPLP